MKISIPVKPVLGLSLAATISMSILIMPWEGRRYRAYQDVGGVWTVCDGHTGPDIVIGKVYTDPECDRLTAADTKKAEQSVDRGLKVRVPDLTKAAFISFEYNTGGFNGSTLQRLANAGDLRGACAQLSRWVFVKGVVIRGLQNRRYLGDETRISERELCLRGLQ